MNKYLPATQHDKKIMLNTCKKKHIEDLYENIPETIRIKRKTLSEGMDDISLHNYFYNTAGENKNTLNNTCFLGAGVYDHYIPPLVGYILSRQEFYTAYTPYQPEMSQGILKAVFEYQTMICELTGMQAANASMYDGAEAFAEAALLSSKVKNKNKIIVSLSVHPEYRQVLKTYAKFNGIKIAEANFDNTGTMDKKELERLLDEDTASVMVQNPNFFGCIEDIEKINILAKNKNAFMVVSQDPVSLGILKSPGSSGADIVTGEGQVLGNRMSYGGSLNGYFAVTKKLMRKIPGRIVGQTTDLDGKRSFVLTMQAREQHIRREKATSNICSNQALNALASTVYLATMGKRGIKECAVSCVKNSKYTLERLLETGKFHRAFKSGFFREFVVKADEDIGDINERLFSNNIIGGLSLERFYPELKKCLLIAVTEKRTKEEIDKFISILIDS